MLKSNDKNKKGQLIRLAWIAGLLLILIVVSALISSSNPDDVLAASSVYEDAAITTEIAEPGDATTPMTADSNGYFSFLTPILRMVAALIVVILCIYVGLYVLRKMMGKRQRLSKHGGAIELIQTEYLAPRRAVSLVKVANRSVLIGVTDNQLSLITELSEDETALVVQDRAVVARPDQFGRILGKAMTKLRDLQPKPKVSQTAEGLAGSRQ